MPASLDSSVGKSKQCVRRKAVTIQLECEFGSREVFSIGSRYQAAISEDIEDCTCAEVQWFVECVEPRKICSYL
jgi:hypothetical protein